MSARKDIATLAQEAGFLPGELEKSRNLRAAICNGTATAEDQLAYQPFAPKWDAYARLVTQRDQADQLERQAPDPARHSGDTSLGEAIREHRDGQAGRRLTVHRVKMIPVDVGGGGLQDMPEAQPLRMFRGSSSSTGHEKIAAGLSAAEKKR
jgi:hypothetical protein